MVYQANATRYQTMEYRRCGHSGLKLPAVSLGLWHNFGDETRVETSRQLLRHAFDLGITHFDLANNYGPPPGSAESNFGRILKEDFLPYRDELIISSKAVNILNDLGTPCLIHQPKYSMFERWVEEGLLDFLHTSGVGSIAFSPLAGGQLTNRYLHGIPADSRAASGSRFLQPDQLTESKLEKVRQLDALAESRGQKLSQMALAWVLRDEKVTSVLIGASKTSQLDDAVGMLENRHFSAEERATIDAILAV